ncbi:elongation factor Ts [Rhizomicrobium palustre]|uniref:Elongation factor Ts n=1 Tax=Rhizomicrobium palustre TaxID=189966 RepID=A0A846N273_9PROT|nr:translation elongation factor Ts [Rhizomicrobium palustre]NIK89585.1 elongation factor Ts [Rhizomicrobium palustre]
MAEITAALVKELRDKTGAGMMDCKKALNETGGNLSEAEDWLRKSGALKAAKKSTRTAAEGLVGVAVNGGAGVVLEVNSETDFVARNDAFKDFVKSAAELALVEACTLEALMEKKLGGATVQQTLTELIAKIGENMSVRRVASLTVEPGVVAAYVHNAASPETGKIGVLVAVKSTGDAEKLSKFGKQVAMHIAATSPLATSVAELPQEKVEHEREIQRELARQSGKPENVIEKMLEGRMRKYYEEVVLLEQAFVITPDITVKKAAENLSAEIGTPVEVTGFLRFQVGEGIEKAADDFASEVAKMAGN